MRFKLRGKEVLRSETPLKRGECLRAFVHDVDDRLVERDIEIFREVDFRAYVKSARARGFTRDLEHLSDGYFYEVKPLNRFKVFLKGLTPPGSLPPPPPGDTP